MKMLQDMHVANDLKWLYNLRLARKNLAELTPVADELVDFWQYGIKIPDQQINTLAPQARIVLKCNAIAARCVLDIRSQLKRLIHHAEDHNEKWVVERVQDKSFRELTQGRMQTLVNQVRGVHEEIRTNSPDGRTWAPFTSPLARWKFGGELSK